MDLPQLGPVAILLLKSRRSGAWPDPPPPHPETPSVTLHIRTCTLYPFMVTGIARLAVRTDHEGCDYAFWFNRKYERNGGTVPIYLLLVPELVSSLYVDILVWVSLLVH